MTTPPVKSLSFLLRRCSGRPDDFTRLLAALALLGAALILARGVVYGPGMHWDSISYISIAWNLLNGNGYANLYPEGTYALWPPLYPLLLTAASFGVLDPQDVAGPLNAIIFGLTIFFAGQYLRPRLQHPFLVFGACIALTLSIPLTRIAAYALSEPLFILFTLLALMQANRFLDGGQRSALIWAAVFTGLALLTRYVGLVLIVALLPALLLRPVVTWRQRLRDGAVYALIALPPVVLWMLTNWLLVGYLTGPRLPPNHTFPTALYAMLSDLSRWPLLLPEGMGPGRPVAAFLTGIILLSLIGAVGVLAIRLTRTGAETPARAAGRSFALAAALALAYLAGILGGAMVSQVDPFCCRMTAPAYLPLLLAAVFALDRFLVWAKERQSGERPGKMPGLSARFHLPQKMAALTRWPNLLLYALVLWLLAQAALNFQEIRQANAGYGKDFAGSRWAHSEVLAYVREHFSAGTIISPSPVFALYTDNRSYVYLSPGLAAARQKVDRAADGDWVLWFHNLPGFSYGPARLAALPGLEPVAELSDGLIFRVNRVYDPAAAWRAEYQAITAAEPARRAAFNLYRQQNKLFYAKEPCAATDTQPQFFLHLFPKEPNDLPARDRPRGFAMQDFAFDRHGIRRGGKCLATVWLPDYPISRIETGQYAPDGGIVWESNFPVPE